MANESQKKVWIAIQIGKGQNATYDIVEAESYQEEAYYEFIASKSMIPIYFKKEGHEFTIAPFSTRGVRELPGLKANEIPFLKFLSVNKDFILSNDRELLERYVDSLRKTGHSMIMRGGKRKSIKKRRSIKRKSPTKKNKKN